jgi:hypothetical protein
MATLLDIGPLTEDVEVRGVALTVQGLTAGHIFQLFAEFPEMRKMVENKQGNPQDIMLGLAPELIAKMIAMALGEARNAEVEAKVKTMGAGDQLTILAAVQRLSFPDGIGPFVDRVTAIMTSAAPKMALVNSSNSTTSSPAAFSASLQMDTPGLIHGRQHRAN